jgi:hypothetical protein
VGREVASSDERVRLVTAEVFVRWVGVLADHLAGRGWAGGRRRPSPRCWSS